MSKIILTGRKTQIKKHTHKRTWILFPRFCVSIGYYGLTWTITGLPGNKYLNFFIAGAVEFVAYTMVIYVTKR